MNLNQNSIHAKLYEWFYNSEKPDNLCPYFWRVVFATIMFIPFLILRFPMAVVDYFAQDEIIDSTREIAGLIVYLILFCIVGWCVTWIKWDFWQQKLLWYQIGFYIINVFLVSGGIIFYCVDRAKKNKQNSPKEPSIIIEFVKAKYNRYCPKINWK